MDLRVFVKPPFRRRKELGRARIEIKKAFAHLEERMSLEFELFHQAPSFEVFNTGKLIIDGTLRPLLHTKSLFDFKLLSTKKSFVLPPKPSQIKDDHIDLRKRVILSLKKVSTPDVVVLTDIEGEKPPPFTFCLEAKFGTDSMKCPYFTGKVRNRNKDLIANLCVEDPEMDFEMSREAMQCEELHMLVYAKNADQTSARAIGRAIFLLCTISNKPADDENFVEMCAQIKDVSGAVAGKMFINVQISPSGRNRRGASTEVLTVNDHTMLPKDLVYGWVKINSVEAVGMNSLKLLGRSVRYSELDGTPMFESLTKQDLLLVMEYGQKWVSHSPVMTDHGDSCSWQDLDFRFLVSREDFLHDSVRISVFNRKLHGKEGLLGSAILALQQFVSDSSLSIAHVPVKLRSAKNKVNGILQINGIVIKDGGGEWIPGTVEAVHNDGRYDVRYDDGELEEHIGKDFLRTIPAGDATGPTQLSVIKTPRKGRAKFSSGAKVEVRLGHQDVWLPATVESVRSDGTYDLKCAFDLPNNNVDESLLRTMSNGGGFDPKGLKRSSSKGTFRFLYGVGDKVEANFRAKGKWYKAKVWKVYMHNEMPTYDLDYASGVREIGVTDDRIRLTQAQVAMSSSFLASPQKSIFDVEPEDEPMIYDEDDDYDASPLTNLADLDFDSASDSHGLRKSPRRGRPARKASHNASLNSDDDSDNDSPSHRRSGRSLSRLQMSTASVRSMRSMRSFRSSRSLSRMSSERSMMIGSVSPSKSVTELLLEKATLVVGDVVEACLRSGGYHFMPAVVEAILPNNLFKIRFTDTNDVVEEMPRDQIRLPPEALEDQERIYPFVVGDKIQANFRGTGEWLSGVISKDRGFGVYDVDYANGRLETKVSSDCIRHIVSNGEVDLKFAVGDNVEVRSDDLGYWYSAVIRKARQDHTYDIVYADGEKDIYVPERLIRPGRNDSGTIPSIKPAFIAGDRVYVKSRSKAFGMEIRAFSDAIHQSNEDVKALFGLVRTVEEEEANLEVKRDKAFKETDTVQEVSSQIAEYEQLNPSLLDGSDELCSLNAKFAQMHEALKNARDTIFSDEPRITEMLKDLKGEVAKASAMVRQRISMNYDFLNHRSGLGDEELHALTVAITGLKAELSAIESAKDKAKKLVSALTASRHICYNHTQSALDVQKTGEELLAGVSAVASAHPAAQAPPTPSGKLQAMGSSHNVLGRFDSNRSLLDEVDPMDYGDIYESNAPLTLGGFAFDPKDAADHVDDLLDGIDQIDADDDDVSKDDFNEPDVDLRRNTCMGGLLLSFKDLRCESTDQESDTGIPTKRSPVKSARFSNSLKGAQQGNLTSLLSLAEMELMPLCEDGESFSTQAVVNTMFEACELHSSGDKALSFDFAPKAAEVKEAVEVMRSRTRSSSLSNWALEKDPRLVTDAKRQLDDKKNRALMAAQSFQKAAQQLDQLQRQCHALEEDCRSIMSLDQLDGVVHSKLGDENRLIEKQMAALDEIAKKCHDEQAAGAAAAKEYCIVGQNAMIEAFRDVSAPLEDRLKKMDEAKQGYVHQWSSLEEARLPLDREIAAHQDRYNLLKQKRDAVRHLHKLATDFNSYKTERGDLLEKEKELLALFQRTTARNKELDNWREQVDAEAATWEWYNRKLNEAGRRPFRRNSALMSMSSTNLSPQVGPSMDSPDVLDKASPVPMRRASTGLGLTTIAHNANSPPPPPTASPGSQLSRRNSFTAISAPVSSPDGEVSGSNPFSRRNNSNALREAANEAIAITAATRRPSFGSGYNSDGGSSGNPAPNLTNVGINTSGGGGQSTSRPTTPRVQAERKSVLAMQQKLLLSSSYYENARIRAIEENIIEENLAEYNKAITALIEDDYKVVKFEKRLYGSAIYYNTLNISPATPSTRNSMYNIMSNLNKVSSDKTNVDMYAVDKDKSSQTYNNDNIKLMFVNHSRLLFHMISDVDNLWNVKDHIEKAMEARNRLISFLQNVDNAINIATECCKQEFSAYNAAIGNLNNDTESIQTIKNILNAHRLHNKYQTKIRSLLHTLLVNNQRIEEIDQLNKTKESSIAASRKVCNEIIGTLDKLKGTQIDISVTNNDVMYHINSLLLQCEEIKILISNYHANADRCDDAIGGLDYSLRKIALERLENDFKTNWEDEYDTGAVTAPAAGTNINSSMLVNNTTANSGVGGMSGSSGHNLLTMASNNSSAPNALAVNSQNSEQYTKVNKLYEEEIELMNKGILFTKQRLDFLLLINSNLRNEYNVLQQIHIQKEYLLFNIAYLQFKDVDGKLSALFGQISAQRHDLSHNCHNDRSEAVSVSTRMADLKDVVAKMKHVFHKPTSTADYAAIVNRFDELNATVQTAFRSLQSQLEGDNGDASIDMATCKAIKDAYLPEVNSALKAYDNVDTDLPMLTNASGGTASNNNSMSNLYQTMQTSSTANSNDFLYAIAALVQGTSSATELANKLKAVLHSLEHKAGSLAPLLELHQVIQDSFARMNAASDDLEDFIEREKLKRVYRTFMGRVLVGNELHAIRGYYPKELQEDPNSLSSMEEKYSDMDKRLANVIDADNASAKRDAAHMLGFDVVVDLSQGDKNALDILAVEMNKNTKEYLDRAVLVDLTSWQASSVMMSYRANLKAIVKPAPPKPLTRKAKEVSKYVPALVANIERKTSTKALLSLALGEQSAWKYLGIKEPEAVDQSILALGAFAGEIKAIEDKLTESATRVVEVEAHTDELGRAIAEIERKMAAMNQASEAGLVGVQSGVSGYDALYHRVVMSDEEVGKVLSAFDDLCNKSIKTTTVEESELKAQRRTEDEEVRKVTVTTTGKK